MARAGLQMDHFTHLRDTVRLAASLHSWEEAAGPAECANPEVCGTRREQHLSELQASRLQRAAERGRRLRLMALPLPPSPQKQAVEAARAESLLRRERERNERAVQWSQALRETLPSPSRMQQREAMRRKTRAACRQIGWFRRALMQAVRDEENCRAAIVSMQRAGERRLLRMRSDESSVTRARLKRLRLRRRRILEQSAARERIAMLDEDRYSREAHRRAAERAEVEAAAERGAAELRGAERAGRGELGGAELRERIAAACATLENASQRQRRVLYARASAIGSADAEMRGSSIARRVAARRRLHAVRLGQDFGVPDGDVESWSGAAAGEWASEEAKRLALLQRQGVYSLRRELVIVSLRGKVTQCTA